MTTATLTERLAGWLVRQRRKGFSAETLQITQSFVLDWLGSVLAGGATDPGRILADYAGNGSSGSCQIVGLGPRSSPEGAALANGGLSHIVEMDDLDSKSVVHRNRRHSRRLGRGRRDRRLWPGIS
jgi:2-methylcitrate dehydratase PrpD